ncbi:MAG: putative Membrane-fusion protein of multidrug efflux transporter [Gammaproteobacteria bacterium]|nr:putative Membrane-fusion protein of multidrug efflux transporter [Gammaproteobacteria bacterium]
MSYSRRAALRRYHNHVSWVMSMKRESAFRVFLIAAVMALSACDRTEGQISAADVTQPVQVRTVHLSTGPITRSITLPAQVIPFQQATLYAKVSGYLKSIAVDKGDKVAQGSVLARIEIPELVASRAKQEAELRAAQADYTRLQESLQKAPDLVVPEMVDQARGRFEVAHASLDQSETLLGYATIMAPFSGIITQRNVDPGALIQANSPIVGLMDFTKVRLQVAVPEIEAARVAVGQPVKVTTDNLPGRQFDGKVTRFTYALDAASRTMLAEAMLDNPDLSLRPGMLVTARMGIEHKENTPLMPVESLVMEKANAFAYTADGGKAVKHPIKTGFNDGHNVEVLEGLHESDAIILVGKLKLNNGQAVQVAAEK